MILLSCITYVVCRILNPDAPYWFITVKQQETSTNAPATETSTPTTRNLTFAVLLQHKNSLIAAYVRRLSEPKYREYLLYTALLGERYGLHTVATTQSPMTEPFNTPKQMHTTTTTHTDVTESTRVNEITPLVKNATEIFLERNTLSTMAQTSREQSARTRREPPATSPLPTRENTEQLLKTLRTGYISNRNYSNANFSFPARSADQLLVNRTSLLLATRSSTSSISEGDARVTSTMTLPSLSPGAGTSPPRKNLALSPRTEVTARIFNSLSSARSIIAASTQAPRCTLTREPQPWHCALGHYQPEEMIKLGKFPFLRAT